MKPTIFGPRAYGEYKISEGLKARLETEYLDTTVPPMFSTGKADPEGKEWVFSAMAGVKKDYRFFKNIRGTAMVLYNLYDADHRSPYAERLVMRFGFEFPMRKKVRQKDADESETIHQ